MTSRKIITEFAAMSYILTAIPCGYINTIMTWDIIDYYIPNTTIKFGLATIVAEITFMSGFAFPITTPILCYWNKYYLKR